MDVVTHKHVGVDGAATARRRIEQAFQIEPSIGIAEEARGAVHAALEHMVRDAGEFEPRRPGHGRSTRHRRKVTQPREEATL